MENSNQRTTTTAGQGNIRVTECRSECRVASPLKFESSLFRNQISLSRGRTDDEWFQKENPVVLPADTGESHPSAASSAHPAAQGPFDSRFLRFGQIRITTCFSVATAEPPQWMRCLLQHSGHVSPDTCRRCFTIHAIEPLQSLGGSTPLDAARIALNCCSCIAMQPTKRLKRNPCPSALRTGHTAPLHPNIWSGRRQVKRQPHEQLCFG